MPKQKKIAEQDVYKTPLEVLLTFLLLPLKIYREIYIIIIERRLSHRPLTMPSAIAYLARRAGIEPELMSEKVKNMVNMKWLKIEHIGGNVNPVLVLSPIWRYKEGIDKAKFAIALREYKANIKEDETHQMTTEEIYTLMNSVCPHTEEKIDSDLCKLGRWEECQTCSHRGSDNE